MKVWQIKDAFGIDKLTLSEQPTQPLGMDR